jgi:hypothetical protein
MTPWDALLHRIPTGAVCGHPDAVALLGVRTAREQAYAPAARVRFVCVGGAGRFGGVLVRRFEKRAWKGREQGAARVLGAALTLSSTDALGTLCRG